MAVFTVARVTVPKYRATFKIVPFAKLLDSARRNQGAARGSIAQYHVLPGLLSVHRTLGIAFIDWDEFVIEPLESFEAPLKTRTDRLTIQRLAQQIFDANQPIIEDPDPRLLQASLPGL